MKEHGVINIDSYLAEQFKAFLRSAIYLDLQNKVEQAGLVLKADNGTLPQDGFLQYFINVEVRNKQNELIEIWDDGALCAYNCVARTKGSKIIFGKWDDSDFMESLMWIINRIEVIANS